MIRSLAVIATVMGQKNFMGDSKADGISDEAINMYNFYMARYGHAKIYINSTFCKEGYQPSSEINKIADVDSLIYRRGKFVVNDWNKNEHELKNPPCHPESCKEGTMRFLNSEMKEAQLDLQEGFYLERNKLTKVNCSQGDNVQLDLECIPDDDQWIVVTSKHNFPTTCDDLVESIELAKECLPLTRGIRQYSTNGYRAKIDRAKKTFKIWSNSLHVFKNVSCGSGFEFNPDAEQYYNQFSNAKRVIAKCENKQITMKVMKQDRTMDAKKIDNLCVPKMDRRLELDE